MDLLHAHPEDAALREALTAVLTADPDAIAATVHDTAAACARLGGAHAPYAALAHHFPGDPGVLAALLLNHVRLQPGEALYLGAGVPTPTSAASASRSWPTPTTSCAAASPPSTSTSPNSSASSASRPATPASCAPRRPPRRGGVRDARRRVPPLPVRAPRRRRPVDLTAPTPQILLATAGAPRLGDLTLSPGQSVFVPAGESVGLSGGGTLFRATAVV